MHCPASNKAPRSRADATFGPPRRRRRQPVTPWLLAIAASSGAGIAQQPPGAPAVPNPDAALATALDRVRRTNPVMREIPWQGHPLERLIDWAPERMTEPIRLPELPAAPGTLREVRITFANSPGGSLVETPTNATGRPAVALFGDMLPNGADLHRAEVADATTLATHPGYLRHLRCDGGTAATLAAELPRFTSLRVLQLGMLLDDQVAAALALAMELEQLAAGSAGLTDAGMFALGQLPALRTLVLYGDLAAVRGQTMTTLHRLQCLRLATPLDPGNDERAPDRRLVHEIVRLPELRELQFVLQRLPPGGTDARELLLEPLLALPALRRLNIVLLEGSLSPFVERLARLPLTHLRLVCEDLTAADAAQLAGMGSLRELDLGGVHFDDPDAAVASLAAMTWLQRLGLAHANVSAEQRHRLVDALPGCVVESAFRTSQGEWRLLGESVARPLRR